jgi:uncharacterized protein
MKNILITGGSGFVGMHLTNLLKANGCEVSWLTRKIDTGKDITQYLWSWNNKTIEKGAIEKADAIIHLAGANIGDKRWTAKRRQLIIDSRVKSGQLIFEKLKENKNNVKAFISASAIGYYGTITSGKIFSETDPPSNDFLGDTCRQWEEPACEIEKLGIRTVKIRTGLVLTNQGGALPKMITPINAGIGSPIGTGRQYMPWIHIEDLCNIYIKAIEDTKMSGAYNGVAPDYKTNSDFSKSLTHVLKKSFWFPNIPSFIIKLIFGKMSAILLNGSRVSSEKIITAGYSFKFTNLESAFVDLLATNIK